MIFATSSQNRPAWDGQPWRLAKSLITLATQVSSIRPGRYRDDGTIAGYGHDRLDASNQIPKPPGFNINNPDTWVLSSDHTPMPYKPKTRLGIVYALDVDTALKADVWDHVAYLNSIHNARDPRLRYIIHGPCSVSNCPAYRSSKILRSYARSPYAPWTWAPNPSGGHELHIHHSVDRNGDFDNPALWVITGGANIPTPTPPSPIPSPIDPEEEDMWQYITVTAEFVKYGWDRGYFKKPNTSPLQPDKSQSTLDYWTNKTRIAKLNDPAQVNDPEVVAFRRAFTTGRFMEE